MTKRWPLVLVGLLLLLLVHVATTSHATSQLYAVGVTDDPADELSLYLIDPRDGSATLIGPIGFENVDGLAFLGDGRLVGAYRDDSLVADPKEAGVFPPTASGLIEIDPVSGVGTFIGLIGDSLTGCGHVWDLTYDPATDILYGLSSYCVDGGTQLVAIDQETGVGLSLGTAHQEVFWPQALAVQPGTSTIYASAYIGLPILPIPSAWMFTIDPVTGAATRLEWGLLAFVHSLASHPLGGELYASSCTSVGCNLLSIDPADEAWSIVGPVSVFFDALVFGPAPPPTLEVPMLGDWGFVALAGVLAALAVTVLRRRPHDGVLRS